MKARDAGCAVAQTGKLVARAVHLLKTTVTVQSQLCESVVRTIELRQHRVAREAERGK